VQDERKMRTNGMGSSLAACALQREIVECFYPLAYGTINTVLTLLCSFCQLSDK